jgi:hypothetical protein
MVMDFHPVVIDVVVILGVLVADLPVVVGIAIVHWGSVPVGGRVRSAVVPGVPVSVVALRRSCAARGSLLQLIVRVA